MKRENTEEFISDAVDIGFKVINNNERVAYSEVEHKPGAFSHALAVSQA